MAKQRTFYAADGYDAVDLLRYARDHLYSAEVLFGTAFQCFDSAAHLSHLAVELLIKSAILHGTGSFQAEHDLDQLLTTAAKAGTAFNLSNQHQGTLFLLNEFEDCRYPNPESPAQIGNGDLQPILQLWNELLSQLPDALRQAFENADQLTKGGRILMVRDGEPDK